MQDCKDADEVRAHYKAVRTRVNQWKPVPKPVPAPEPEPEPPVIAPQAAAPIQQPVPEPPVPTYPPIARIVVIVCERFKISRTDLLSQRRTANIVRPRQIAMYLAKEVTLRTLPEIGRRIGGRDHTTVLHAVRKIARLRETDQQLDGVLRELEALIQD